MYWQKKKKNILSAGVSVFLIIPDLIKVTNQKTSGLGDISILVTICYKLYRLSSAEIDFWKTAFGR